MYFYLFLKTLLSDTAPEESRWPPELILLREKFTARSQLEVAQLQIKHEDEVSTVLSYKYLMFKPPDLKIVNN